MFRYFPDQTLNLHRRLLYTPFILLFLLFLKTTPACAQYKVRGVVYDSTRTYPLELVTVQSTSGKGSVTNTYGEYEIDVAEKDSIWFSYLNKPTVRFAVLKMPNPLTFDISLKVNVPILKEVKIRQRNYKQDSLQNREDYAKIFNYRKPGLSTVTGQSQYGGAVGFDLDEIINIFRFRRNKSMLSFQRRLLTQEEEKFVDHRFSKAVVRRLTSLDGDLLDNFMLVYRPSYEFAILSGDYDFQKYIKDSYERYKKGLPPFDPLRMDQENRAF